MAKRLPLKKRLEIALTQTSSEWEKDKVYGLLAITARDVTIEPQDLFYGTLTHETLNLEYNRKPITPEDIQKGKQLADILFKSINLPQPSTTKDYRGKMIAAMDIEYKVLRRYFVER